ncbi:hypothetical protein CKO28_05860 [Rhodovibrio sodomensis]|uniref:DUF433 domain-containing protein n=1 Tax=Rhodovibrio sodomensis TaxID=1088 RepID=A0ABS1DC93_9PROT|nr:DUF433 domain-containing protein [Rhodovibrio sodomensis]MBK1667556.1 hypothetical protein [Rhodovibrio sodomensis]
MGEQVEMLSSHEAAYLAGVNEREIHRAIDEDLVPKDLVRLNGGRRAFTPAASVMIAFYVDHKDRLTGKERRRVIDNVAHRVSTELLDANLSMDPSTSSLTDLSVEDPDNNLKLVGPYIDRVRGRLDRLKKARDLVHSSSEILSGTPVIRGTRVPVHSVAGTYGDEGAEGALKAYPNLDKDTVELAKLYADTHPPRGRPKAHSVPEGATVVRTRRRKRSDGKSGAAGLA